MKKIFFGNKSGTSGTPFWQPWGFMGCLGRLLGFLLLLLLLLSLLGLFRKCQRGDADRESGSDPVAEWRRPIEGGEDVGLPSPEDNVMPPFEELEPVPSPDDDGISEIYPNLLYVILDSGVDDETFLKFAKAFTSMYPAPDHRICSYSTGSKTLVLEVPENRRDEICRELPDRIPDVKFMVVPIEVMAMSESSVPRDTTAVSVPPSWHLLPIQAYDAWEVTQGSPDVIVGIVDSYMDLEHPSLRGGRCIYPYSVINGDADVSPRGSDPDIFGHGTMVTSIAVGNPVSEVGISGIAPRCKYIPVSVGDCLNTVTLVEGLLYCMYHGASVINLSCGVVLNGVGALPLEWQIRLAEQTKIQNEKVWDYVFGLADKHNVTIVWSAGNYSCLSAVDASKRNHNTIIVSAVDTLLRRADFSNFGNFEEYHLSESTISAPGVKVRGALPGRSFGEWDGTSFSAPIITGTVALLKSRNDSLTTPQIIEILKATGTPTVGTPEIGGLVQIKDALDMADAYAARGSETER